MIGYDGKQYLIDLSYDLLSSGVNINEFIAQFEYILKSNDILKICYDSKQEMYYYKQFGVEINNYFDKCMIEENI